MKFLVRPYNADFGLLSDAISKGLHIDGLLLDANIISHYRKAFDEKLRPLLTGGTDLIIDNNLERARRQNFAAKVTYKNLPYLKGGPLTLERLTKEAAAISDHVLKLQSDAGASLYTSPYIYLDEEALTAGSTEKLNAQIALATAFGSLAPEKTLTAIAFSAASTLDSDSRKKLLQLTDLNTSLGFYLLIFNIELAEKPTLSALVEFLCELREKRRQILLSHAPFYVYCFEPHGVTGFASGINYLTSLDDSYLARKKEIEGITHNYYLKGYLMKATPQNALELINAGAITPCDCPYCIESGGVPFGVNEIRKHYLFARSEESAAVNKHGTNAILHYLEQAEAVMEAAAELEIGLIQAPVGTHWRSLLGMGS